MVQGNNHNNPSDDPRDPRKSAAPHTVLSESELLDWVDGRLPGAEQERLAAASGRAGLSSRIAQMQANKRALRALNDEAAPPELADRVLAALEREALLGLAQGRPLEDHPPVLVFPKKKDNLRWLPKLAVAAGLLLMASGAAYWGAVLFPRQNPVAPSPGPLAANDKVEPLSVPTPFDAAPKVSSIPDSMESALTGETAFARSTLDDRTRLVEAVDANAGTFAAAATPPAAGMTDERALALARENRLVVRVIGADAKRLAGVDSAWSRPGRSWRISRDVPAHVVAAAMPRNETIVIGDRALGGNRPGATASTRALDPMGGDGMPGIVGPWSAPLTIIIDRVSRVRGTMLADATATEDTLSALREHLSDRLRGRIVFEELDMPVATPSTVDPDSLLWWTGGPASWVGRVNVPIVVEAGP